MKPPADHLSATSDKGTARVLLVHRGSDETTYPGVIAGWQELLAAGEIARFDHLAIDTGRPVDAEQMWRRIEERATSIEAGILVLHHFHARVLPDLRPGIEQLRTRRPDIFVSISNGDPFANQYLVGHSLPRAFLRAASEVDLVISTSMGGLGDQIAHHTRAPVVLLPNGVQSPRFGHDLSSDQQATFDVVFIGSNNRPRNPAKPYHWAARRRERMIRSLAKRYGTRFAVFGHGWNGVPGSQGPVPFEKQWWAARQGKVVIGGIPFSTNRYYMSNRPFIQIAAGVPFVDLRVEGTDLILRDGLHWHLIDDEGQYVDRCDSLLAMPAAERDELGRTAAEEVRRLHSESARVRAEFNTIVAARALRDSPATATSPMPDLSAFLPEVDRERELPLASRNWSVGKRS